MERSGLGWARVEAGRNGSSWINMVDPDNQLGDAARSNSRLRIEVSGYYPRQSSDRCNRSCAYIRRRSTARLRPPEEKTLRTNKRKPRSVTVYPGASVATPPSGS